VESQPEGENMCNQKDKNAWKFTHAIDTLLQLVQNIKVNLLCKQHNTKRINSREGRKEAGLGPGNVTI